MNVSRVTARQSMAHKRSRQRQWVKRGGLVACILIAGLWGVALFRYVSYQGGRGHLRLSNGMVAIWIATTGKEAFLNTRGWIVRPDNVEQMWAPHLRIYRRSIMLAVPMWMLLHGAGIPTVLLWWRDRQPLPGCCQFCGYDLTGNVSGVCPECGQQIKKFRADDSLDSVPRGPDSCE